MIKEKLSAFGTTLYELRSNNMSCDYKNGSKVFTTKIWTNEDEKIWRWFSTSLKSWIVKFLKVPTKLYYLTNVVPSGNNFLCFSDGRWTSVIRMGKWILGIAEYLTFNCDKVCQGRLWALNLTFLFSKKSEFVVQKHYLKNKPLVKSFVKRTRGERPDSEKT